MKTKYTFTPLENMPGKDMNACRSLLPMDAAKWERMSPRLQKYFVVVPGDEPIPAHVANHGDTPETPADLFSDAKLRELEIMAGQDKKKRTRKPKAKKSVDKM